MKERKLACWAQDFRFWKERGRNTPEEVWASLEHNTQEFQARQMHTLFLFVLFTLTHNTLIMYVVAFHNSYDDFRQFNASSTRLCSPYS